MLAYTWAKDASAATASARNSLRSPAPRVIMYRISLKNMARWTQRGGGQLKMLSAPSLAHVIS